MVVDSPTSRPSLGWQDVDYISLVYIAYQSPVLVITDESACKLAWPMYIGHKHRSVYVNNTFVNKSYVGQLIVR